MEQEPNLSNLTDGKFGKPRKIPNPLLEELGKPHITSFNYFFEKGLHDALPNIPPIHFKLPNEKDRVEIYAVDGHLDMPKVPVGTVGVRDTRVFPTECRQRHASYTGKLTVRFGWRFNDETQSEFDVDLGDIPIMIKSNACHLSKMSAKELIAHNEHPDEWGGYFVVSGLEKLIRMLLLTRRNYPLAVKRKTWKQRGYLFSEYGIQIKCVTDDQTSRNNLLHFLTNGTAKLMFANRKNLYFVPVVLILRCLLDCSDTYIYKALMAGFEDDSYFAGCVKKMLVIVHQQGLHSHSDCKDYLGRMFRSKLYEVPPWSTDAEVTDFLLDQCILVHLPDNQDKFNLLVYMTQKLFQFAQDKCDVENIDSIMTQELMLGGHLYLQIVKEKVGSWMYGLKKMILKRAIGKSSYTLDTNEMVTASRFTGKLNYIMQAFLATGNLSSHSGLGLMQETGLVIVAENINRMRYMSHFRAVHRGSFFQEMRTTEARVLLPDAWGFVCPVHTPDGAPCGLLNHMTMNCQVTDVPDKKKRANIGPLLASMGMITMNSFVKIDRKNYYTVLIDGKLVGFVAKSSAAKVVLKMRIYKIENEVIPNTTEIAFVPQRDVTGQFAGVFIFTGPARMMRPCHHLATGKTELLGTFEQVYMDICVVPSEIYPNITTHMELSKTSMLSNLAKLIPMPDNNQSPRNMYQCQMGKQTMGTPIHTWHVQSEHKLYRLQTPQSPLFRPVHYDHIELDNYAMGTNAIVAVISYTGYDMEDAIVINKSSIERGLAHACIYKTTVVELPNNECYFARDPSKPDLANCLDVDGLPMPGSTVQNKTPIYCYYDSNQCKFIVRDFKDFDDGVIDKVQLCGNFSLKTPKKAMITYRVMRNPMVGDKLASRAGQKGICSRLWPAEDMPFTETSLVPDIIFNPHGFPSRMTVAMMIELMAGKSAAVHGTVHDATPFRFNEEHVAIDHFGKLLVEAGYNYYGNEPMYSGMDGREMTAQIFFGVVHYQRLRHMVSDKWQVRRTGPVEMLTRQPIGGRKRGGGVRFGEMERDSLISHGASFLLHDRLFHCSDETEQLICGTCGSILSPISLPPKQSSAELSQFHEYRESCRVCGDNGRINKMSIPFVFKYFCTELASVNVNVKLHVNEFA